MKMPDLYYNQGSLYYPKNKKSQRIIWVLDFLQEAIE